MSILFLPGKSFSVLLLLLLLLLLLPSLPLLLVLIILIPLLPGVVLMFFLCQTPALVSRVIWAVESYQVLFDTKPLYTFNEICNFLIILNSAGNIIPYYFFGKRFRLELLRLFCKKELDEMPTSLSRRQSAVLSRQRTRFGSTTTPYTERRRISSLRASTCVILNQLNGSSV